MMTTMVNDEGITFKQIEEEIFRMICSCGQSFAKELLEKYDDHLMETRDVKAYRNKGLRETTVKTVFGEVTYKRRVYEVTRDDGLKEFVYLLDEQLRIPGVGMISQNLADQLVSGITEMSYRECAAKVSAMTGQSISHTGVWKTIQALGEKVCDDEKALVKAHKSGAIQGDKKTPVLFEEADGVLVGLQREKNRSAEIKVGIAYDGWQKTGTDRYTLDNKVVVAGFSTSREFQDYREATIAKEYNTDEIEVRIMNADGAQWIRNICDPDTVFQLDPFHRNKAIKEAIPYKEVREEVHSFLKAKDIDGMFHYLEIYRDSLTDDQEIERAEKLIKYFSGSRKGLLSYQEQGVVLPENPNGLVYRNMGTMENHIWSIIARRMKHNHASWSIKGGNHLAKILAKKCSGHLDEVSNKLKYPLFEKSKVKEYTEEILSAASIKKKTGKGYAYPVNGHLVQLDGKSGIFHQMMLWMVGCGS